MPSRRAPWRTVAEAVVIGCGASLMLAVLARNPAATIAMSESWSLAVAWLGLGASLALGLRHQSRWHTVGPTAVIPVALAVSAVQIPWCANRFGLLPLDGWAWLMAAAGATVLVGLPWGLLTLMWRALQRRSVRTADSGPRAERPLTHYAWLSVAAAVSTMSGKTAAYLCTQSVALLSDAAESLVNLAGAGFAVVVLGIAARPADESHPFGHGRAEYFSSGFTGALILVAAAAIFWAAAERLAHPQALQQLDLGMWISAGATAINWVVARVLLSVGRKRRAIALEADGKHLMTDVWTTVAVLLGLGGVMLTGWVWLDSAIAAAAAINIVWAGTQLIVRSLSGLIGVAIPAEERAAVERVLDRYRARGIGFHDLRARVAGTQHLMTLHVLVPGTMTVKAGHDILEAIEDDIAAVLPNLLIVTHLEPLEDPASFDHAILTPGDA